MPAVAAGETYPEMAERMSALKAEFTECGDDLACMRRVSGKMNALAEQMRSAPDAPKVPSASEIAEQQAAMNKARAQAEAALVNRQDDPCYETLVQKETARRAFGSDLPWVTCIPVQYSLNWDLTDRYDYESLPDSVAKYELTDRFAGFLEIVYDQDDRRTIRNLRLTGPAGEVDSTLERISAGYLVEYPRPWPQPRYGTTSTSSPSHFIIDPRAGVSFQYERWSEPPSYTGLRVWSSTVRPIGERIVPGKGELVAPWSVPDERPAEVTFNQKETGFTLEDVLAAIKSGELERRFPVEPKRTYLSSQDGELLFRMRIGEAPAMVVTPGTPFRTLGAEGRFTPAHAFYAIANPGSHPIRFKVSTDRPWLKAAPAGGTVPPKGRVRVRISVASEAAKAIKECKQSGTVQFVNRSTGKGDTTRKAELERVEEQRWLVRLSGSHDIELSSRLAQLLPGDRRKTVLDYWHGGRFEYKLAATITLQKECGKKNWTYKTGRITDADVQARYSQSAPVYSIERTRCEGCDKVRALKGRTLSGQVSGKAFWLNWPTIQPTIEVRSRLALKCRPGPGFDECERLRTQGSTAAVRDRLFFAHAQGHQLPLADMYHSPEPARSSSDASRTSTVHNYTIRRVKQ